MSTSVRSDSFQLVGEQVAATLQDAHAALESYAEGDAGAQGLQLCADHLHAARGALQITEVYGASLLAEEMEATCRFLAEGKHPEQLVGEGVEALSRAIVQLPAYVERIMGGGRDIPLVLLPLLNDLRATRGNALLSESTLLLLNVAPPTVKDEVARPEPSEEDLPSIVGKLRPQFQLALLGWIKGKGSGDDVKRMAKVAARLESAARTNEVHQLWWVVGGVLEALDSHGLESSVALKRLIGQADREIKRLQEQGEEGFVAEPATDLINNLLYYIARSKQGGPRCDAIRSAFNLSGFGPGDEQVEELREQLSAPSARLMKTVADAIREDLGKAKDVLDIYVRTGMQDASDLADQVGLLSKISDTLGVLGLGALREVVQQRSDELRQITQSAEGPQEAQLVSLAAALLEVENRLDGELLNQVSQSEEDEPGEEPTDAEFQQVAGAVLRECMVNLAHIKESITQVLTQSGDGAELDNLDEKLRGISAGLVMLGKTRAVDLLNRIGNAVRNGMIANPGSLDVESMNRLADSIVSLEYYMETMQAGRKEPVYMLDNCDRSLQAIETDTSIDLPVAEPPAEHDATLKIDIGTEQLAALPEDFSAVDIDLTEPETSDETPGFVATQIAEPADEQARTAILQVPVLKTGDEQPDPELLEIFIEEAREEIGAIGRHFPVWANNQSDEEALITVRRSFHTLKGSGRMVGAEQIGEFSWNIENLMNRLITKTIEVSPPLLAMLGDAVAALPDLLEQLEVGTPPTADIPAVTEAAAAFADGKIPAAYAEVAEPAEDVTEEPLVSAAANEPESDAVQPAPESPEEAAAAEPAESIDPVLLDILARESAGHISAIRSFLDDCTASSDPFLVSEAMHHACHTLHGSVTMAEAQDLAVLTEPLYRIVEPFYRRGQALGPEDERLCRVGVDAIEQIIAAMVEHPDELPDTSALQTELEAVAEGVGQASDMFGPEDRPLDISVGADHELPADLPTLDIPVGLNTEHVEREEPHEETLQSIEFDGEIAAIFAEEADEILEAADAAVAMLAQNSSNQAPVEELQRHLHTLKGGARMAGVLTMGDFSHELETLLNRVQHSREGLEPATVNLLQTSIDELHRMREQVPTGRVDAAPAELMARLAGAEAAVGALELATEVADSSDAGSDMVAVPPAPPVDSPPNESPPDDLTEQALEPSPEVGEAEESTDAAGMVPEPANLGELARELTAGEPPAEPSGALPEDLVVPSPQPTEASPRREMARVDSAMLEALLNNAGEISISHSRMNQQVSSLQFNLEELGQTVRRLQGQLRKLEIETEAQILFRHQNDAESNEQFDPLELDRYSTIQQLSRALAETASDVSSIKDLLQSITGDAESILVQQARTTSELQDMLMRTRMVPFDQHIPRLSRLVRQQAQESGKQVELTVQGSSGELDRQVMEKMLPPFEHILRNAVIHGIERPEARVTVGKAPGATITIRFAREGSQVLIEIADDGAGLNLDSIRNKAVESGIVQEGQVLTDEEAAQLILRSGLSTADRLTQSAGRGIGMDVVVAEIAKLGGTLAIDTEQGKGVRFTVRLPYTLAITQAFIVRVGTETYALPLPSVEGVVRLSSEEFTARMAEDDPMVNYGGRDYRLRPLGVYLERGASRFSSDTEFVSIVLVEAGKNSTALITDEAVETREIVLKPISPMLAGIRGVAGATILGDGRVVIILDAPALVRSPLTELAEEAAPRIEVDDDLPPLALVVDDSITMRRVTQRLLERNGMRVIAAKDGVEAIEVLQDHMPDIIILDVEMPRMDGYEFATHVRNTPEVADLPIIMVTSRTGEKHRARAIEIGVNDYLGKPYQEFEMLAAMQNIMGPDFNLPKSQRGKRH